MAFLLFLNGQRVDDVVELDPTAALILGNSSEAHIPVLDDTNVAEAHGQVYPAEGHYWFQDFGHAYTFLNLEPLVNTTYALSPHDVIIVGRTFLKFVIERPAARGVVDRTREIAAKDREIERLRQRLTETQGTASGAKRELEEVRAELEGLQAAHGKKLETVQAARRAELDAQRVELDTQQAAHRAELDRLQAEHRAELDELNAARQAERASSKQLSELTFQRAGERDRVEGELRELRGRASQLAVELAVGSSGAT